MKKLNTASIITVALILGILVMLNVIGIRYFARADLTTNQIYSLSDASKDIVQNVEGKLIVRAYFSPDLPGQYAGVSRYLRDMLEDYRAYSKGHLEYQFIDPGSEQKLAEEAQSFRIPPMQVQSVANDKLEVKRVYMGIAFIYGDKRETIPTVTNTSNLEYEISSIIYRMTSPDQPILGVASTGSQQQQASMQRLYEALGRVYDVRPVSLNDPIDPNYDGLFILAPRQSFTDWQLFNIDQYIMNGGRVGMFMNSFAAGLSTQQAQPYNLGVNKILNAYGIGLGDDMVIDAQSNMVEIQQRQGFFTYNSSVNFVYFPVIDNLNSESVITRELQQLLMYYPSSVDTTLAAQKGYNVEVLARTSDRSGRQTGNILIDPTREMTDADFNEPNIPLAATVTGTFTSAFANSGPPMKPAGTPDGQPTPYTGDFKESSIGENRLLVVGDGLMTLDTFIQQQRDLTFTLNAADWLLQSGDLISIRSREIPMVPLAELPDFSRNLVKWANRLGPMILLIAMGIALWQSRRIRNKKLTESMQEGNAE